MKTFRVEAVKSVDNVAFGATRKEVRTHLGDEYREMRKSKYSKNTMDAYDICHAYYTPENTLEAIEIFPEATVIFNGQPIPTEYEAAVQWLKSLTSDVQIDEDGAMSVKLGLSLYAPDGKIESIMVADDKYFAEV